MSSTFMLQKEVSFVRVLSCTCSYVAGVLYVGYFIIVIL